MLRIASDVGGTFTDSIAYDPVSRRLSVAKVSTTPQAREIGTIESLRRTLQQLGATGSAVAYIGHGMTTATNAVIQRRGAKAAFVTNHGFTDLLLIGRQDRPSLYDVEVVRAPPLVPRQLCYGILGRLDAGGREVEPLSHADLERAAADMRRHGVEAVAVVFLHAYANPVHERAAKAVLRRLLPDVTICISSEVLSEFREFERASTVVLNAYLTPLMATYLGSLARRLHDADHGLGIGRDKAMMVMEATGGLMTIATALAKPVHTILSGPAGGVIAGAHFARLVGADNVITMDIGGTSTDISLVRNGEPETTRLAKIGQMPIRLPTLDIHAIGAGGGSIASIDDGGALRVGPESAEALPGPACYARGGTRATICDANLVLGRLSSATRLGGSLRLDLGAAQQAIEREIAAPLGLDVIAAAAGILRVAHANMVRGIRVVSIEHGHDPREYALVAFGGAGPMHATAVARELHIGRVIIPPSPGILCAFGQLVADLRHDLIETHIFGYTPSNATRAQAIARRLSDAATELLARDQVPPDRRAIGINVEARYVGQSYELQIAFDGGDAAAWSRLGRQFHAAHQQRFGHADAEAPIEIVGLAATAIGRVERPALPMLAPGSSTPDAQARRDPRQIFIEANTSGGSGQWTSAHVFERSALLAGNEIAGPAVIEELSATTVLYPGDLARVDVSGALIVECAP